MSPISVAALIGVVVVMPSPMRAEDEVGFTSAWLRASQDREAVSRMGLKEWLLEEAGGESQIVERRLGDVPYGKLRGCARLAAPLTEGRALVLAPATQAPLAIHFLCGEKAATLIGAPGTHAAWAGYVSVAHPRPPRERQPPATPVCLTSTDGGRMMRTELIDADTWVICLARREVPAETAEGDAAETAATESALFAEVWSGDVRLAAVRLPGPLESVWLEGEACFDHIALVKTTPPRLPSVPAAVAAAHERPGDLPWLANLADAVQRRHDDGDFELRGPRSPDLRWAAVAIPGRDPGPVDVRIDAVAPGAFVYLGRRPPRSDDGPPLNPETAPDRVLAFVTDQKTQRLTAMPRNAKEQGDTANAGARLAPAQFCVAAPFWVRLTPAAGGVIAFISHDRSQWAGPFSLGPAPVGETAHIGVGLSPQAESPAIRIGRVLRVSMPQLERVIDPALFARAPSLPASRPDPWLAAAIATCPSKVERSDWLAACGAKVLAGGPPPAVAAAAIDRILASPTAQALTPLYRIRLIDELTTLVDFSRASQEPPVQALWARSMHAWKEAAGRGARDGFPAPASMLRFTQMSARHNAPIRYQTIDGEFLRREALAGLVADRYQETLTLLLRMRYFAGSDAKLRQFFPLAPWALAQAAGKAGDRRVAAQYPLSAEWRTLVVDDFSKEVFNQQAEMEMAMREGAPHDVCTLIANLPPDALDGLSPSPDDPRLSYSLMAWIDAALTRRPEVQTLLEKEYAPRGLIRVREAIREGDHAAVALAALQFYGTKAAGVAEQYLGDQAMAAGRFSNARIHYRRAARFLLGEDRRQALARVRFAAAMMGLDEGTPVTAPVQIGDIDCLPQEFEKLLAQLRVTHEGGVRSIATNEPPPPLSPPAGWTIDQPMSLDDHCGGDPRFGVAAIRDKHVPWIDRQFAVTRVEDLVYVSNRFQVSAYDLAGGKKLWAANGPEHRPADEWPLVRMKPLVTDKHVFVRSLKSDHCSLLCYQRMGGRRVWEFFDPKKNLAISDPLIGGGGRLLFLALEPEGQGDTWLKLVTLDPATGSPIEARRLIKLRQRWHDFRCCQVAQVKDHFVAALGGATVCFDSDGLVIWARSELTPPPNLDGSWALSAFDPPVIDGEVVYVADPGAVVIQALYVADGRVVWRRPLPHWSQIVGVAGDVLLVRTHSGFAGLHRQTGATRWEIEDFAAREATLILAHGVWLNVTAAAVEGNRWTLDLVWRSGATGKEIARQPLPALTQKEPRACQLTAAGDTLWMLYAKDWDTRTATWARLRPSNTAPKPEELPKRLITGAVRKPILSRKIAWP